VRTAGLADSWQSPAGFSARSAYHPAMPEPKAVPPRPTQGASSGEAPRVRRPAPTRPELRWIVALCVVAIVLSVGAIGFSLLRGGGQADQACRDEAWNALPDGTGLPDGWTVAAGNFYVDGAGTSFVGPTPSDGSAPTTLYLQVTCYGDAAHQALTRSHDSAIAAGGSDVAMINLGDESVATEDPSNGSTTVYVRQGGLLAILVAPSALDEAVLEQAARAVDAGLSSAASTAARPSPTIRPHPSTPIGAGSAEPSASDEPSATPAHVVPDLEKLLPATAGGVALTKQSILGTTGLGGDPSSEALLAAIDGFGKKPADFQIAAGYDETGVTDLQLFAFRLAGVKGSVLGQAIVDSYQVGVASGVTATRVTISGKAVTHISYDDASSDDYVYVHGDIVYDVGTTDPDLAAGALASLP